MKPTPRDSAVPDRPRIRTAKAKFSEIVAVCTKCAKRQGLGKRALRDLLKAEIRRTHTRRKLRIVETGCLGPCPKRALAVATGASLAQGRILLIDPAAAPSDTLRAILPASMRPEFSPKAGRGSTESENREGGAPSSSIR